MADGTGPTRMQQTETWQDLARHDQSAAQADVDAEGGRYELDVSSTRECVGNLEAIRDQMLSCGWTERAAEAEKVLEVARENHAAAVAGIDYRDLDAHFHGVSQATPERAAQFWPDGYPETAAAELAAAERETDLEAGS